MTLCNYGHNELHQWVSYGSGSIAHSNIFFGKPNYEIGLISRKNDEWILIEDIHIPIDSKRIFAQHEHRYED